MNCVGIDDILSTTVLYEGFFDCSDIFKFSNDNINKLKEIANKYKKDKENFNTDIEKENSLHLREYIYRFDRNISINKISYPLENYSVVSYEIIDLSNEDENLIISMEEVKNHDKLDILLNNIKVNNMKLRIKSEKNIWPQISEIKIEKIN